MTSKTADNKTDVVLDDLCARNASVELHHISRRDELTVARTRLLGMDENVLYLDKPQSIGKKIHFRKGQRISVNTLVNGVRLRFETEVVDPSCKIELNENVRVRGLTLTRPVKIIDGQRRNDYRASTVCFDTIVVSVHVAGRLAPNASSIDASRFTGRMVNLSRGGLLIKVDREERQEYAYGKQYFASFVLPDDDKELTFWVELRHHRTILEGEADLLGMKFFQWPRDGYNRKQAATGRFIVEVQRRGLRNR